LSVVITSYRRAWALPYSLSSLVYQSKCPNEVIIVLKPSGDGSEQIIEKFSSKLPIKTVIQREGFVVDAVHLGIENASGDIILFIDDDAIAEINFIAKYEKFFDQFRDAGGATGIVFRAYLEDGHLVKTMDPFIPFNVARSVPYRKPLKIFEKYSGWISKSGLSTTTKIEGGDIVLSGLLCGANMGFIRKAIDRCPVSQCYKKSRKGFNYESLLAYFTRIKGFNTYKLLNPNMAPIVWHLMHGHHLTTRENFWSEFWVSYDVFQNYFRYKKLGADVSFLNWVEACMASLRRKTPARLLALLYTLVNAQM
jgi:glycosyltransferase involved in cell wall biosynthesis